MPISSSIFSFCLASNSNLVPKASKQSAAPHLLDTLRLPCLAIFIPLAEITNHAVVEILNVFASSPPVPTISNKSSL